MPLLTIHWNMMKRTGDLRREEGRGREARLDVLMNLVGRANMRLRCWPTVEQIMEDTGFTDRNIISSALAWLYEHGAIYYVPVDKRIGPERAISKRRNVYQLTGMIRLNGEAVPFVVMQDGEIDSVVAELQDLGAKYALQLYDSEVGDETEPTEDEYVVDSTTMYVVDSTTTQPEHVVESTTPKLSPSLSTKKAASRNQPAQSAGGGFLASNSRIQQAEQFQQQKNGIKRSDEIDRKAEVIPSIVLYLESQLGHKITSRADYKRLIQPLTIKNDNEVSVKYPSLAVMFEQVLGFKEYVEARVNFYRNRPSSENFAWSRVISDIRNFNRSGDGGNPGWLIWKQRNAYLCKPIPKPGEVKAPHQNYKTVLEGETLLAGDE
jgi:hypothetical protein